MEDTPIQVAIAAAAVWLLQGIKGKSRDPDAQKMMARVCRVLSALIAFLTSLGITYSVEGSLEAGGQFILTFPSWAVLVTHAVQSFAYQEGGYMMLQNREQNKRLEQQNSDILSLVDQAMKTNVVQTEKIIAAAEPKP